MRRRGRASPLGVWSGGDGVLRVVQLGEISACYEIVVVRGDLLMRLVVQAAAVTIKHDTLGQLSLSTALGQ